MNLPKSVLTKRQVKVLGPKVFVEDMETYQITVKLRYDDECGNGHNSFAMTAMVLRQHPTIRGRWLKDRDGCCHELIVKHFPDLEKYVKWHLTSSDGPMHYVGNTLFHAGDRDCWGKRKGEPKSFKTQIFFNRVPIPFEKYSESFCKFLQEADYDNLVIMALPYTGDSSMMFNPKYTFEGFGTKWHEGPFDNHQEAENFLRALRECDVEFKSICVAWGEGKTRDFKAARSCAVWPEATDEQLSAEPEQLKAALIERLPNLMKEFKYDMESLGFVY